MKWFCREFIDIHWSGGCSVSQSKSLHLCWFSLVITKILKWKSSSQHLLSDKWETNPYKCIWLLCHYYNYISHCLSLSIWGNSWFIFKRTNGKEDGKRVKVHLGRKVKGVESSCAVQLKWGAASPALSHTTFQYSEWKVHKPTRKWKHQKQELGKIQTPCCVSGKRKAYWKYTTPTHALRIYT